MTTHTTETLTLTFEQALQMGLQKHQAGQLTEAENLYLQLLAAVPGHLQVHHLLGALYLQAQQPAKALEHIDAALQQQPAHPDFLCNRGEALRLLQRPEEAVAVLRQVVAAHPAHIAAHSNLGNALRDLGHDAEAVKVLRHTLTLKPDHLPVLNNLALTLRDLHQQEEARSILDRAIALYPDRAELYNNRADFARELGDLPAAIADYQRALQLAPAFTVAAQGFLGALCKHLKAQPPAEEGAPALSPPGGPDPDFSVIVCSHRPHKHAEVAATFSRALAGESWELILIDDARSLAEAYQRGVGRSRAPHLIFAHDDIAVLSPQLGPILRQQLQQADLIGIAGTNRLLGAHWQEAGWPHLHGMVARPQTEVEGGQVDLCLFGVGAPLIPGIEGIDGCFFAARRDLFDSIAFDSATFDGFHGYDVDLAYGAHLAGKRVAVSTAVLVAHDSPGNYDEVWQHYAERFSHKYQQQLPRALAGQRYFPMLTVPSPAAAYALAREVTALRLPNSAFAPQVDGSYSTWIKRYERDAHDPEQLATAVAGLSWRPLLSVLVPVYNPRPEWLAAAIDSVLAQAYPDWELCLVNDASTDPAIAPLLDAYAARDARIRVLHRSSNGHICAASNDALALASGEFIALLDHDDLLPPHALYWVAKTLNEQPQLSLIYSDEDKLDGHGRRCDPYFKPDWNPDLLRSQNYLAHLAVYRRSVVEQVGAFRSGFEGAQDHDLALRMSEAAGREGIAHIPRILYHWRIHEASTAGGNEAKPYAISAGERAINEHLQRTGRTGQCTAALSGYRVRYTLPEPAPLITVIMPTRNGKYLRTAVDSLYAHTRYPHWQLLIVDNGSDQPETLAYLEQLQAQGRAQVLRDDRPFNFSALNNAAAAQAQGQLLLFINDDVEATHDDWLSEMAAQALRPEVGAVGARLWYPDGRLQHAGVILVGGVAGHAHKRLKPEQSGYFGRARLVQNFSAVTAACLLITAEKFRAVGGFDEQLAVAFNDVDLCLRLQQAGYWNVWTPYAELIHHESVSRGHEITPAARTRFAAEVRLMQSRWQPLIGHDPAYNPNLTNAREDFSLAWPPRLAEFAQESQA